MTSPSAPLPPSPASYSRDRVLDAAERLFMERGYSGVRLADIARVLGVKAASLYYHAPGGKEELYLAVMRRHLERRRAALDVVIGTGPDGIEQVLQRVLAWSVRQPPLNSTRFFMSDVRELSPEQGMVLTGELLHSAWEPLETLLTAARARGEIRAGLDPGMITGLLLSAADGMLVALSGSDMVPEVLAEAVCGAILHGILADRPG
jgi:AcrR family transcriptional regulator